MVFNMFFGMLLNNFKKKGGDNMITYSTLFEFCKLLNFPTSKSGVNT